MELKWKSSKKDDFFNDYLNGGGNVRLSYDLKKLIMFASVSHFYCVCKSLSVQIGVCVCRYEGCYVNNVKQKFCVCLVEACGVVLTLSLLHHTK